MQDVSVALEIKITLVVVVSLHCTVQKLLFLVLWLGTNLKNLGTNLSSLIVIVIVQISKKLIFRIIIIKSIKTTY